MKRSEIDFLAASGYTVRNCGAVARALHHEAKINFLPAVSRKFLVTTKERKLMSKTIFKRISLAVVIALGVGVLSTAPSSALTTTRTLAIDATTDTAIRGDSASAVLTHTLAGTTLPESSTIQYTCIASGMTPLVSCPTIRFWKTAAQMTDTANIMARPEALSGGVPLAHGQNTTWVDSLSTTAGVSTVNAKITSIANSGTYAYTIFVLNAEGTAVASSVSWTVTVAADDTTGTSIKSYYFSNDLTTAVQQRTNERPTSDSSVVVDKGSSTPAPVAYGFFKVANAAGETKTVYGNLVNDSLTATITSGPGLLSNSATTPTTGSPSVVLNVRNTAGASLTSTETLTVLSTGIAGTTTIRVTNLQGTTVATLSVIFTGAPASVSQLWLSDTIVQVGAVATVTAIVKDSGSNVMKSGKVYIYSSDTKIAGLVDVTYPNFGNDDHESSIATTGKVSFSVPTYDTGTVTLTIRDSWTVSASTWSSEALTLTITGTSIASLTASFDKTTYAPGERAILTLTAKDIASRGIATGSLSSAFDRVTSTPSGLTTVAGGGNLGGTNSGVNYDAVTFNGYLDTGVETRVVTMPTYGTDVKVEFRFGKFGTQTSEMISVIASAKVVDPNAALIASAQAAAEAATDAANEAIDAANAATDAANLSAEAADAATVAAEEARDAADAATAAVEELATQVATLMAALKAQITTLANTVAKIAKKVKA